MVEESMVKKILIGVAAVVTVLVLGFVAAVAMKPNEFRVSRSATMAAPSERAFAQVNDFHKWDAWSPWAKLDPNAKNSFTGPDAGEGATFGWSGNDQVGEGKMTITESKPGELVRLKLMFIKPMEDTSDTEFTFKPEGEGTRVTWTMSGTYKDFMSKAICMCMNMDKMMGEKFDEGLASMKAIVEKPAAAELTANDPNQANEAGR
jgi:Polyketide cyclase / dehydrase and lipid transport